MMNYILIGDDCFVARSCTSIVCRNIILDLVILQIDLPFGRKC